MKLKKSLSVILSIFTLLTLFPSFSARAAENDKIVLGKFKENEFYDVIADAEYVPRDLIKNLTLRETDIPESMKNTNLRETNAVVRLKNKEDDLSVVKYLNSDGTVSDYIMAENVKYVRDGIVYDKTNRLEFSLPDGGYINPDNDVKIKLPLKYDKNHGVLLNYGKYSVEISPDKQPSLFSSFATKKTDEQGDYIVYNDVFDKNVDIEYHACYSGVKDNIILNEKASTNEFVFTVKTNGLVIDENGVFYVDNEPVFTMGQLVIYDKNNNFGTGKIEISEIEFANKYEFKIIVDSIYLNDDNTVYPVIVDPIITTYNVSNLTCITLKQNSTSVDISSHYLLLGMSDNGTKYNRVFIRSNKLSVLASHIASSKVKNAYVYLFCYYANSTLPSGLITFTTHSITENWDETPTVTNTLITSIGAMRDSNTFNPSLYYQYYAVSIKNLFKYLIDCNDTNTRTRGFALKLDDEVETNYATFASSKETVSTLRPYIVIITEQSGSGTGNTLQNKKLYRVKNYANSSKYMLKQKNTSNNSYYLNYGSDALTDSSTENKSSFLTFHKISDNIYAMSFISSKEDNKNIFITYSGQQSTNPILTKVSGTPANFGDIYKWYVLFNSLELNYIFISYSHPYYRLSTNNTIYSEADKWLVEPVGLDVPLIKQISNYCGPCSALQTIIYFGEESLITNYSNFSVPEGYTGSEINAKYQKAIGNIMGTTSSGTTYYRVVDFFKPYSSNNEHGNTYGINHNYTAYDKDVLTTIDLIFNYIKKSIDHDYPVIIHANTSYFSYYCGNVCGHFICLVGYIPGENKYIVRDCNNNDNYFGEFIVTGNEILNMLPSTYNSVYRHLICYTY